MWLQQSLQHFHDSGYIYQLIGALLVWLLLCSSAVAANGTHTVKVGITDTTPPSVPTNVAASLSGSLVTLTWDAAIDDQAVAGYEIYRNGVSTTITGTSTSYQESVSDPGGYSYTVRSFDYGGNQSSLSAATEITYTPSSGGGGSGRLRIREVAVDVFDSTVQMSITLSRSATVEVRYGRSQDYELGTVVPAASARDHQITLPGLLPGVTYFYEVVAEDSRARTVTETGTFLVPIASAATNVPTVPPVAVVMVGGIPQLRFSSLGDTATSTLLVLYRPDRPPFDRFDGDVVYRGAVAANVPLTAAAGYYAVFVLTDTGGTSAGTIVAITESGSSVLQRQVAGIAWSNTITLQQGARMITTSSTTSRVYSGLPLTVTINDVEPAVIGVLIRVLSVEDASEASTFTLNKVDTAYQGTITLPLNYHGDHYIDVILYDRTGVVAEYRQLIELEPGTDELRQQLLQQIRELLIIMIGRLQALLSQRV